MGGNVELNIHLLARNASCIATCDNCARRKENYFTLDDDSSLEEDFCLSLGGRSKLSAPSPLKLIICSSSATHEQP